MCALRRDQMSAESKSDRVDVHMSSPPNALRNIISRFETHARIFLFTAVRDAITMLETSGLLHCTHLSIFCFTARLFSFMLS
jgi:hypothetical protein